MGLFSSKKKVFTDSQAYNLAGDISDHPNFLKAAVVKHVLGNKSDVSFGRSLVGALANSTVIGDSRLYRQNTTGYPYRMKPANLSRNVLINPVVLYPQMRSLLSLGPDTKLNIVAAEIDGVDPFYFAEAWIQENAPAMAEDEWVAAFVKLTNTVLITREGEADVSFAAPADLIWAAGADDRRLLYVAYQTFVQSPITLLHIYSEPQLYVYRMNSGNAALDALDGTDATLTEFFPVIPVMQEKAYSDAPVHAAEYDEVKKAYRQLSGSKISKLIAKLEENDEASNNLRSIYLVKGVSLNTTDKRGKQYILKFFRNINALAPTPANALLENAVAVQEHHRLTWTLRSQIMNTFLSPLYGAAFPDATTALVPPKLTEITLSSVKPDAYRVRLAWSGISESTFVGNAERQVNPASGKFSKVGDILLKTGPKTKGAVLAQAAGVKIGKSIRATEDGDTLAIYEQVSEFSFTRLLVEGLSHDNYVYGSKSVRNTPKLALDEEDADTSSFIVPLHYPTWKSFSLSDRAQLSYSTSYLVFNSVKIVKIKWYQTGIFKIIFAIAAIALSVFTAGGSLAVSGGILGANVAIGTALGASVATAAIVGAVANYVASMVLTQLISWGATKLLGDKLGAILGALISFVAMSYAGQFGAHGNFNVDWAAMLRVENLMGLTNSVTGAYQQWLMADTADIYDEMALTEKEYKAEMKAIEAAAREILGGTSGEIDPMMFTNATEYFGESRRSFLSRTLLTGSDISAISIAMVEDFVSMSLELPTVD